VLLVRPSARTTRATCAESPERRSDAPERRSESPEPLEVYMIRRHKTMRFLGGFYAFPGGKVDAADWEPEALARCRGLDVARAESIFSGTDGFPALAFWITAVRELLEETGLLLVCDADERPVDLARADIAAAAEACRKALMAGESFTRLLAAHDWYCDLRQLRYLSHFITPRSSPIRFTARFFLCPVPDGQVPRLFTEETSEGFWIHPGQGYRRFLADEMAMAEPAEYGLAYLAQFGSLDDVWAAHADGRLKFHGIVHKIDTWRDFDWKNARWNRPQPR
jgi:8-oxo-dGTP pyrophosphatase MutT (NUDIX family)